MRMPLNYASEGSFSQRRPIPSFPRRLFDRYTALVLESCTLAAVIESQDRLAVALENIVVPWLASKIRLSSIDSRV